MQQGPYQENDNGKTILTLLTIIRLYNNIGLHYTFGEYTTNELDPMKWSILLPRCGKKLPLPEPKARVMVIFITSR